MERQPGDGSGAGEEPVPGPGLPGGETPGGETPDPGPTPSAEGSAASGHGGAISDPGLAGFVKGGLWDSRPPSAALAAALVTAAGEGWRCEGGLREEIVGRCGRRRCWSRGCARPSSA